MSSPARSSVSATSGGQGGGSNAGFGDDASPYHFPPDLVSAQDRKDEALAALRSELMAALHKEVKSLDDDNWMFAGPRSQIHRVSRTGGYLQKQAGRAGEANQSPKQTKAG